MEITRLKSRRRLQSSVALELSGHCLQQDHRPRQFDRLGLLEAHSRYQNLDERTAAYAVWRFDADVPLTFSFRCSTATPQVVTRRVATLSRQRNLSRRHRVPPPGALTRRARPSGLATTVASSFRSPRCRRRARVRGDRARGGGRPCKERSPAWPRLSRRASSARSLFCDLKSQVRQHCRAPHPQWQAWRPPRRRPEFPRGRPAGRR